MLFKAKLIISGFSAVTLAAAAVVTGVMVSTAQSPVAHAALAVQEPAPAINEPAVIQQNRLNANPGPATVDKNVVPPAVEPVTNASDLTYGSTALPIPVVPDPAAGYAPWDPNIVYLLEGTNQPVTKEAMPAIPAGAVVQAIVTTSPAKGHFGSSYSLLTRFVVQKAPVVPMDSSQLVATRFLVYQDLSEGKVGPDKDADFFPGNWSFGNSNLTVNQKITANGFAPLVPESISKRFTDEKGVTQDVATSQDMALIIARYANSGVTSQLTLTYDWTTYPDANHNAGDGEGKVVFSTNFVIQRAMSQTAAVYDNRLGGATRFSSDFPALTYQNLLLDGRKAELTINNQFGTIAYTATRNVAGLPTGDIAAYGFLPGRKTTLADGRDYEVVTGGSKENRDLISGKLLPKGASSASADSLSKPISDLYIGSSFIADSLALKNVTYDGTEFNIFSQIPADSAVARTPLVSLRYRAASADDAVKLLYRTKIDFNFMSGLYFTDPKNYEYGKLATAVSVGDLQRFIDKPYNLVQLTDLKSLWPAGAVITSGSSTNQSVNPFDNPLLGNPFLLPPGVSNGCPACARTSTLLDFVNASTNNNLNNGSGDQTQLPSQAELLKMGIIKAGQSSDKPFEYTLVRPRSAVQDVIEKSALSFEKQTTFDFRRFDPYKISQNQFFDVADFGFLADWWHYSADAKAYVLSHLFNPETTRLKVGAYVRYTGTELLFYLIPYVTSLPKVSFAQIGGVTLSRDLGFSYEFFNVKVNVDEHNDSSIGWWNNAQLAQPGMTVGGIIPIGGIAPAGVK